MTHTNLPDEILKTDGMGRVRTPKARREALLAEFERSGVSGKKNGSLRDGRLDRRLKIAVAPWIANSAIAL